MKHIEKIKNPQSLQNYIDRVGADQINFRKFIIKIYEGNYYLEGAIISIDENGIISCSNKKYFPTKEEQEAIENDFKNIEFPKQIGAKSQNLTQLKKQIKNSSELYEFWSFDRKSIIMIQEKRTQKNGIKKYIPWTFFSDGVWRALEPDSGLPLWKPKKSRNKTRVMIHEGAKAAQFIDDLVNNKKRAKELKKHPFGEHFQLYEHWGLIGGALAPQRTNYDDLVSFKPVDVVYVCDNDEPGKAALQKVSKLYKRSMRGIQFDQQFPVGFDFADEMPENLFNNKIYKGPTFQELLAPATWATIKVMKQGKGKEKGRTYHELNPYFIKEWSHSLNPDVYIRNDDPSDILTSDIFNDLIAPFSHVDNTARLFKKLQAQKAKVIVYDPSRPSGIFSLEGDKGKKMINTFESGAVIPIRGDASLFLEFMEKLFPIESDRQRVMKWVATLVARPDIKMNYGLLLISEMQGVGKTTLGESILAPLLGMKNVSFPSEMDIVESQFNEWAAHKRLAIVNEIYAGNSDKPYNKLKSIIADKNISINKKFQSAYVIDNWLHMFACSNSIRSLKLDNDDRRWLLPKVTEKQQKNTYWNKFYKWLDKENGLEIIYQYLIEYEQEHGPVFKSDHAPSTEFKKEVIEDTLGHDSALVVDVLKTLLRESEGKMVILKDQDVVDYVRNKHYDGKKAAKILRPLMVRKLAKNNGWYISEAKTNHNPRLGVYMKSTHFLSNFPDIIHKKIEDFNPDQIVKIEDFEEF